MRGSARPDVGAGHFVANSYFAIVRETWCEGEVVFPDEDGLAGIYDMKLWFNKGHYSVVARDQSNGEIIEDTGECDHSTQPFCFY